MNKEIDQVLKKRGKFMKVLKNVLKNLFQITFFFCEAFFVQPGADF
jgi:hypothetical protein